MVQHIARVVLFFTGNLLHVAYIFKRPADSLWGKEIKMAENSAWSGSGLLQKFKMGTDKILT